MNELLYESKKLELTIIEIGVCSIITQGPPGYGLEIARTGNFLPKVFVS